MRRKENVHFEHNLWTVELLKSPKTCVANILLILAWDSVVFLDYGLDKKKIRLQRSNKLTFSHFHPNEQKKTLIQLFFICSSTTVGLGE